MNTSGVFATQAAAEKGKGLSRGWMALAGVAILGLFGVAAWQVSQFRTKLTSPLPDGLLHCEAVAQRFLAV